MNAQNVLRGLSSGCGCGRARKNIENGTHGRSNTAEYQAWGGIKKRCYNHNYRDFRNWGGRGITMCDRWRNDFAAFYADMGPRPSPHHTIERIDNNGNYEPANCRWATRAEQAVNTRRKHLIAFNGETMMLAQWARRVGIDRLIIMRRLSRGWTPERALTEPPHPNS